MDVGGGVAAIASVGRGRNVDVSGTVKSPVFWSWVLFALSIMWLLGMFAAFGGYKGDVAS